jgi:adenine-specific DNA-methyltransferase
MESVIEEGFPSLMIDTSKVKRRPGSVIQYLESFPKEEREKNITFTKKRKIWYQPNDGRIPDAFFPYMHHQGPRLIINNAGVTSTNTIHRVFFCNETITSDYEKNLLAISLQTTYSQLSAELEGRVYGSGALKHEPSEAKSIKIIWSVKISPNIVNRAYKIIDSLIRQSRVEDARRIANRVLMGDYKSKFTNKEIPILEEALMTARKRRYDRNSLPPPQPDEQCNSRNN